MVGKVYVETGESYFDIVGYDDGIHTIKAGWRGDLDFSGNWKFFDYKGNVHYFYAYIFENKKRLFERFKKEYIDWEILDIAMMPPIYKDSKHEEFKPEPGSVVKIRQYDDLKSEFGANLNGTVFTGKGGVVMDEDREDVCGKFFVVTGFREYKKYNSDYLWGIRSQGLISSDMVKSVHGFRIGDYVHIRKYKDMEREFGCDINGNINVNGELFKKSTKCYCGDEFHLSEIDKEGVIFEAEDGCKITLDMVELVEEWKED